MNNEDAGIRTRVSENVFPKDLLSEITLQTAPPDVKGAAFWTLLHLWNDGTDRMTGTAEFFGALWYCSEAEAARLIGELKDRGVFKVSTVSPKLSGVCPGNVRAFSEKFRLVSRRLERRHKKRKQATIRKRRERDRKRHGRVTPMSADPSISVPLSLSLSGSKKTRNVGGKSSIWSDPDQDIYKAVHDPKRDPIATAFQVIDEAHSARTEGFLKKARRAIGDKAFRDVLAQVAGEIRVDDVQKPGAILTMRLKTKMGAA